jgi:amino acid permease
MLKGIHLVATIWFVACTGYLVAIGLRQVGFNWWLVFSLSGYSTSMLLLLICLYLFAFYHGIRGTRRAETEHPLTATGYYMFLYVSVPLFAGVVFAAGTEDVFGTSGYMIHVAMGTLKATFLAWVVIDPLVGILEMDLPASRRHRAERRARMKEYDRLMEDCGTRNSL